MPPLAFETQGPNQNQTTKHIPYDGSETFLNIEYNLICVCIYFYGFCQVPLIFYHLYQDPKLETTTLNSPFIVYVWIQYDVANIEQWTEGYGWRQNQEAN